MIIKTIIIKFDRKNEDGIVKKKKKTINTMNSNKKNRDII